MEENKMQITVVDIDERELFAGAKVVRKKDRAVREIFVIPQGKTISECVYDGSFVINKHIDYDTVMLNKHLFQLVNE